jgi:hypothetical protein
VIIGKEVGANPIEGFGELRDFDLAGKPSMIKQWR